MPGGGQAALASALILAGGMSRVRAEALIADGTIDLAGFGQPFISPDLVACLRNDRPLAAPDRETNHGGGAQGFVDYPPHVPA